MSNLWSTPAQTYSPVMGLLVYVQFWAAIHRRSKSFRPEFLFITTSASSLQLTLWVSSMMGFSRFICSLWLAL